MIHSKRHFLAALCLLGAFMPALAAIPAMDSQGQPLPTLAPLIKQSTPAVVNIAVSSTRQVQNPLLNDPYFRRFFNIPDQPSQQRRVQSAGSGVIIDAAKGIIVTNNHVIAQADEIKVSLFDGSSYTATLLGTDPDVDIAVLKIDAKNLIELKPANSDLAEVGDFVVAIGNPFGLNQTVTSGIVSALGRSGLNMENYENFIQTDASINPGNSGGALINLRGQLLGINTAIIAPSGGNVGIGFAIPINMAMYSVQQIIEHGEVKRGQLGVVIQDISEDLAQAFNLPTNNGVLVAQVEEGSAADKAGIKTGDVIVKAGSTSVNSAAELRNQIGLRRLGEPIELNIYRKGKMLTVKAIIDQTPKQKNASGKLHSDSTLGKRLQGAKFAETMQGLQILDIEPNSQAMQSGLQPGDVIISANQQTITTLTQLHDAIALNQQRLLLQIIRRNMPLFVVIR